MGALTFGLAASAQTMRAGKPTEVRAQQLHTFGEEHAQHTKVNYGTGANKTNGGPTRTNILTEDFSGATLPTGWTNSGTLNGAASTNARWELRKGNLTDTGSRGGCNFDNAAGKHIDNPIQSPTRANGFMIYDDDRLMDTPGFTCGGSNGIQGPHVGRLVTPVMDFTTATKPVVEFYQDFRNFHAHTYILYSIDGGANYSTDTVWFNNTTQNFVGYDVNESTDNSYGSLRIQRVIPALAGQSNVKVAFVFDASWGTWTSNNNFGRYYWMLDDVSFYDAADYDVSINDIRVDGLNWFARYGSVPASQTDSVIVSAVYQNLGSLTATGVVNAKAVANGSTKWTANGQPFTRPAINSSADTSYFLSTTFGSANGAYKPVQIAGAETDYTFSADINTAPNVDADATNDSAREVHLIVSDSVFAVDHNSLAKFSALGTASFTNGNTGFQAGNLITLKTADTITSITVRVSGASQPGGSFSVSVSPVDTSLLDLGSQTELTQFQSGAIQPAIISSDPNGYVLTAADITNRFVTISLRDKPASQLRLAAGTYYVVMTMNPTGGSQTTTVSDDGTVNQPATASIIGILDPAAGTYSYFTNGNAFFIRANFGTTLGLGVNKVKNVESVTAYPNPTSGNTNLSFFLNEGADVTVSLRDITGRTVSTQNMGKVSSGMRSTTLATENLAAGVYTYEVNANGSKTFGRLVVNR